jgi:hypothetical protein
VSSSEVVKKTFIELLEKDVEFRYAVVGFLGISEILRSIEKLGDEVRGLREGQNKLWNVYIRLDRYVRSGFSDLRRILGSTFESFAAAFIEVMLEDMDV